MHTEQGRKARRVCPCKLENPGERFVFAFVVEGYIKACKNDKLFLSYDSGITCLLRLPVRVPRTRASKLQRALTSDRANPQVVGESEFYGLHFAILNYCYCNFIASLS